MSCVCPYRIGLGTDLHRLAPLGGEPPPARPGHPQQQVHPLVLAGIRIDSPLGTIAHSDGDVVLHALTDALLGAVAAGDIGELFPDTDPAHRDRPSHEFVRAALAVVTSRGWVVGNADVVIHCQQPRLAPYKQAMRQALAGLLQAPPDCVSVKAKTGECVDAVGRSEAIAASVSLLLHRPAPQP